MQSYTCLAYLCTLHQPVLQGHDYPQAGDDKLRNELIATVRKVIGPIATPDAIHWAPGLPKTRSGKIMRRILRKIAARLAYLNAGLCALLIEDRSAGMQL